MCRMHISERKSFISTCYPDRNEMHAHHSIKQIILQNPARDNLVQTDVERAGSPSLFADAV